MSHINKSKMAISIAGVLALGQAFPVLGGTLDEIIVTGKPGEGVSKFESTVSVNTLSADEVIKLSPRSAAEVLRAIPGVRSEASAGEGNTNIAVRGVPIASGGSKFVQLQEDGLPVLQFGDIIVGTADQFLRIDDSLQRVEVLKGSSSATLASNAPAGVVNFISKTGEEEGGSVTVSTGLDYDNFKTSFDYGGALNEDWRFHVGGFYREGEGVREAGFNASKGGQLRANLTRELDNGHFRIYAKYLNDSVPTYLPMPLTAAQGSIAGFDAGSGSNISNDLRDVLTVGATGGGRRSGIDNGNHSDSTSIGAELVIDLADDLTLSEKFRYSQNSGTFFGAFTASIGSASDVAGISSALADTGANGLGYVSGAGAGAELSASALASLNGNGLIQNIRTFDNELESLDNFTNDLQLTKSYDDMSVTLGYYKATQEIDVNWYWQTYVQDVSNNARLMNVYADGVQLTENGQLAYGAPDWGGCCTRDTALEADLDALYVAVNRKVSDALTVDASIRYDEGEATGHYSGGTTVASDMNNDGTSDGQLAEQYVTFLNAAGTVASGFEYDWSYMSYSLAANYVMSDNLALFSSISKGSRVNADRLGDGGFYSGGTAASGSVENELSSFELGAKIDEDDYSVFATFFYVETDDVNSESTNANGGARVRGYESTGLEVEANATLGAINLRGSMTWTDAEIVSSNNPDLIGNTPRRQADFVWSLSPSYQFGDHYVGATLIGTGDSYGQDNNSYEMDGYTYVNLFADFAVAEGLNVQLSVNNLTDTIGVTEDEGQIHSVDGTDYIRARSIAGRTAELSVRYSF